MDTDAFNPFANAWGDDPSATTSSSISIERVGGRLELSCSASQAISNHKEDAGWDGFPVCLNLQVG